MRMRTFLATAALFLSASVAFAQTAKRPMTIDDIFKVKNVSSPQISPNGDWIAYVVSTTDTKADRSASDIWLVSYDGKVERQITFTHDQSESQPRWSPDGQYLSFVSSRPGPNKGGQIWVIDIKGGEARQLTDIKGNLNGYEWAPDSKRIAMVIGDPDPEADSDASKDKAPKPIVLDRYKFKQDVQGYLRSDRRSYVYLYDVASKRLDRLTTQKKWDESAPAWSPDGSKIAFASNRSKDPDRTPFVRMYVAEAKAGATEKQITPDSSLGERGPDWSPDGKWIAYLETDEMKYGAYSMDYLTIVASDGSAVPFRPKSAMDLDRGVSDPLWSADSKSVNVFVTDDRSVYPMRISVDGAKADRLLTPPIVVGGWSEAKGRIALMAGSNMMPNEVHVMENGRLRQLTRQNEQFMNQLALGAVEEVNFNSKDGTKVGAMLTYPVNYTPGKRVPMILWIHGGPNGQDQNSFQASSQLYAANGYAVLQVNYRGSSGRGKKFSRAIAADWGNFEVQDLHAGVDHVVAMGVADPDKLGVGGWSYGGILTDYLIASDNRFKAASSGAGTAFTVSYYGTDQYIIQYDNEIGPPWDPKAWETYQKLAYPFLKADRIKTPTLFMGGQSDYNVPIAGSEQMYQALRSLGVDTQLIVYPNSFHGISRPSYVRDRYERYLGWYSKYVLGKPTEPKSAIAGFEGKWKGSLRNIPAKPDAAAVEVEMEIGAIPTTDNSCTMWKTTYLELGVVKQTKDYKLCRGTGADDLYVDEGNNVKLSAKVIGDALVIPFKYDEQLLISTVRLRGESLEEEILTVDDKPAVKGVQPMNAKSVQRITLTRVTVER